MAKKEKRAKKKDNKTFRKLIIVLLFLICVIVVLKYAYNYVRDDITDTTNIIINNNNVTSSLKQEIIIEDGVVYISKEDISNFFDPYIYYDEDYNQIITSSGSKIASIVIGENTMTNNGSNVDITASVIERNDTYYIPFSELSDIYNVKVTYIEETDRVVIDSLDKKYVVADSSKTNNIKQERTIFSRTLDTVERGDSLVIVTDSSKDGWVMVRTDSGILGYVKESTVVNETTIREDLETENVIEGNISMIWDYFSEYGSAPTRTEALEGVNVVSPTFFSLTKYGQGEISENVGESGEAYIEWAHNYGYEVWACVSNNSYIETTSEIMRDYKLRQQLIENIVNLVLKYDLDGINIDFENMYAEDKALFSRFIIELEPRLKEIGAVLSVDITAPDGSDNWSMCYDRHTIGKVADYVVFMAYDQYGSSSTSAGTTAGYNWVETNLQKLVGTQEEIDSSKIILGIPFYTRVWYTDTDGELKSMAVNISDLEELIPDDAELTWDEDLKQYVTEFTQDGKSYQIWIEDETSIEAKLSLVSEYNLAGAAYWKKGGEMSSIWSMIAEILEL